MPARPAITHGVLHHYHQPHTSRLGVASRNDTYIYHRYRRCTVRPRGQTRAPVNDVAASLKGTIGQEAMFRAQQADRARRGRRRRSTARPLRTAYRWASLRLRAL